MADFYGVYPVTGSGGGGGVTSYTNLAAFPSAVTSGNGALGIALDTDTLYVSNGTTWLVLGSPSAAFTLGALDAAAATATGANLSATGVLSMQSADTTHPGLVNTTAQTFGGTKTFANIIDSGLTASQAVVTNGSKQLSSLAYTTAPTGSTLVQRDINGTASFTNVIESITSTVSAAQTITMDYGSSGIQRITGTSTVIFTLPDATTMYSSQSFDFNNNSTGTVTVNNKGGSLVATVPGGGYARVINTDNSSTNGTWDVHNWLANGSISGTTGTTLLGKLTVTGATETTSNPVIATTQTWNAAGVTFTGETMNITSTASAAASKFVEYQQAGTAYYQVGKNGGVVACVQGGSTAALGSLGIEVKNGGGFYSGGANTLNVYAGGDLFAWGTDKAVAGSGVSIGWASSATPGTGGSAIDTYMTRKAAASIQLGAADAAAPVAQTLSVQSVVAGTSNTAGTNFTIKGSAGTGTGAGGKLLFQTAVTGTTGSTQNAYATALSMDTSQQVGINTATPASTLHVSGTQQGLVTSVSADTTLGAHYIVAVDDSAGTKTMTLPAASSTIIGRIYRIKKSSASNTTVIARAGSDTIDGLATYTMSTQYQSVDIVCLTATTWGVF